MFAVKSFPESEIIQISFTRNRKLSIIKLIKRKKIPKWMYSFSRCDKQNKHSASLIRFQVVKVNVNADKRN